MTSLADELQRREEELNQRLRELHAERKPIEEELDLIRELRRRQDRSASYQIPYRGRQINWRQIARDHDIPDRGDSGHRDVRRERPDVHAQVPHYCIHDCGQYP